MKLNKRTDIAIQVLLYLRNNNYVEDNHFSGHQISSDLQVSYNTIRKVFATLNELGFTQSRLGQNGGVSLTKDYNQISIKSLLIEFEQFGAKYGKLNCEICNITPSCSFVHITYQALTNFFNTYQNIYLDDL